MSTRPSRRSAAVRPHDKFAELRALREAGKTRLSAYEVEEEKKIYEEVDEEDYRRRRRERLLEDDFVVDDRGEGYVDNGEEDDWDRGGGRERYSDEEASEGDTKGSIKLTAKQKRQHEEEKKKKKAEQEGNITKYLNSAAAASTKAKPAVTTEDDEAFMADLLGDFDNTTTATAMSFSNRRRIKGESGSKTRRMSPPIQRNANTLDVKVEPGSPSKGIRSSPPPFIAETFHDEYDEYESMNTKFADDDIIMNDMSEPPSSPTVKAVQRKTGAMALDDEDDDVAVMEIKGVQSLKGATVNISGSRPTPKVEETKSLPAKVAAVDSSSWKRVTANLNVTNVTSSDSIGVGKLDPRDALDEDGSLKFFWLDYTEVGGSLCLFGKVRVKDTKKYASCFVKVDEIERVLYFLPREYRMRNRVQTEEEVVMENVFDEIYSLMKKHKVEPFRAQTYKRKYAFELPDIPKESDYLQVKYSYSMKPLEIDPSKFETFSHVFGTHTALFEQFVVSKGIMGPCWLNIKTANFNAVTNASWCKLELQVDKPSFIERFGDSEGDAPPLTLMSIALRTKLNIKENRQEVIAASARIYENVSLEDPTPPEKLPCHTFTVIRPVQGIFPPGFEMVVKRHGGNIKLEKTEQSLLNVFLTKLQLVDPDVLIGHQLENVDYSILLNRMRELKINQWHRIGRMRRSEWPKYQGRFAGTFFAERGLVAGRLMCDLANDLGKSLMTQCQSWSLTEMCELMLSEKRTDIDTEAALKTWGSTAQGLLDYLLHCETDTYYIAAVALKVQMLPLAKVLTNLAGNSWARTLSGTRAERNEYILLHEFYKNDYICPDKYTKGKKEDKKPPGKDEENPDNEDQVEVVKKKDKYKGGLVFDPAKGLYDKFILVMDFNSLYPSIIQEYNICFTTVERTDLDDDTVPQVPKEQALGILPKLISNLVNRRRQVKGLMKDKNATPTQKAQWDIKQQALKLTANSMYGCLGYDRSRFYARPLAMLVTFKGREILLSTKELAESMQLEVVYGDTDSVMINTNAPNYYDALKVGQEFKKAVNDKYRLLEIDIDNVFQRLLLHAKKKYAALNLTEVNGKLESKMEVKGLDMRRREYCKISKDASAHILNEIFSGDDTEVVVERIHDYLRDLGDKMRNSKFPATEYTIYTKLGKEPEEYPDGKTMPHVQVALRKKARGEMVKVGDIISFIVTGSSDGTDKNPAERAYALQDVVKDPNLVPDHEWYLIKQIFPPIERLCSPIEGTDRARIAGCLGLDAHKYQIVSHDNDGQEKDLSPLESTIPDEERFRDAAKLMLRCRKCGESAVFEGLIKSRDRVSSEGIMCANPQCTSPLAVSSIVAQLEHQLRAQVAMYYDSWLICSDSACGNRTRQMSVYGKRCLGSQGLAKGCSGKMVYEYSAKRMYNQLLYFQSLFDTAKAKEKATGPNADDFTVVVNHNQRRFGIVKGRVEKYLDKCGRGWVSMDSIFSFCLGANGRAPAAQTVVA
ncbi:DNA polymerase alpha catalytic subunit [Kalaharituber pfeilii]|nr:DNA polymerase alpha catalytic subunit [Kalaharituber pfeilii]